MIIRVTSRIDTSSTYLCTYYHVVVQCTHLPKDNFVVPTYTRHDNVAKKGRKFVR